MMRLHDGHAGDRRRKDRCKPPTQFLRRYVPQINLSKSSCVLEFGKVPYSFPKISWHIEVCGDRLYIGLPWYIHKNRKLILEAQYPIFQRSTSAWTCDHEIWNGIASCRWPERCQSFKPSSHPSKPPTQASNSSLHSRSKTWSKFQGRIQPSKFQTNQIIYEN